MVTETEKLDLLARIASSTEKDAKPVFDSFGKDQWFDPGAVLNDLQPDELVGTLVSVRGLLTSIAEAIGDDAPRARRYVASRFPGAFDGAHATLMPTDEMDDVEQAIAGQVVRPDLLWVFRPDGGDKFPVTLAAGDLPWQLGLITAPGYRYVLLVFDPAHFGPVHIASIRHVVWEYRDLWHWAGRTRPLGPASTMVGLREGILRPPPYGSQPEASLIVAS